MNEKLLVSYLVAQTDDVKGKETGKKGYGVKISLEMEARKQTKNCTFLCLKFNKMVSLVGCEV
jgi:hypothetical protein